MARGAAAIVAAACARRAGSTAIVSIGGSGNSAIAAERDAGAAGRGAEADRVSTLASGDTRPYVGASDVTMTYSVVDIAGINRISARILANAAGAIAGHGTGGRAGSRRRSEPLVGASMFGVTTPCVTAARERLEELGYEVLVFHATGTGGQSMEALVRGGFVTAVLDVTTTELADELVGGVLSAGPDRLEAAGGLGIPQVVSLGALDMVNFGPVATVPERVPGAEPLRAQPDRDADADDARGVRRAGPADRAEAERGARPGWPSSSRCGASRRSRPRASRSTTRRPTRRCSRPCASTSTRASRRTGSISTSTIPRLRVRWRTGSTSSTVSGCARGGWRQGPVDPHGRSRRRGERRRGR